MANFKSVHRIRKELNIIKSLIEKKYGRKFQKPTFSANNNAMLIIEDRTIYIKTERTIDNEFMLELIYTDQKIKDQAQKKML
ncbi:hypothetical protein AAEX28_11815 [Lentisphaerota bacterium WC36G]|nr:hypothetical protein LJT99_14650 [Lentisphaerae bacterium WC36]